MKSIILFFCVLLVFQTSFAQVETKFCTKGASFDQVKFIKDHPKANKIMKLPSFDAQELINEDKLNKSMDRPFRFGKGFDVEITLNDGAWCNVDKGRLWSMEFQSKGAYSINFVFDQFFLSDNAKLYAANADGTMLYGPVTSKQNTKNGFYLTDLISGDNVTIYLYEPDSEKGKCKLKVKRVVHAYKNLFSTMAYGNLGGSESCNNDVACFPAWDDESDAVALVLLSNGTEWCSGSLLMSANQSFRPYFLSAFHCLDDPYAPDGSLSATEISNAENWMFKFQYKMLSCGGNAVTAGVTYNGATFRAAWNASDFSLMEMNNSPFGDSQFTWLGWDRSGNTPTSGTGIHHPAGDVMKISFETNQFQTSSWGGTDNHWLLAFDDGVVQKGSSGSPILDQNDRVVGQLHGNQNYNPNMSFCSQSRAEYGRFNNSWTGGGTNNTRLSNWLDPCTSGAMTTNTMRSPYLSGSSAICSSGSSFTVVNPPPGTTISWNTTEPLTRTSAQGANPCTFIASGSGSGTVVASIVTDCGTINLPVKTVWVGAPAQPLNIRSEMPGFPNTCYNSLFDIEVVDPNDFGQTYDWVIQGATVIGISPDTRSVTIQSLNQNSYLNFSVRASNSCGVSNYYTKTGLNQDCGGYYLSLSPNPASSETTITLENSNVAERATELPEWELEVFDQGQQLKTKAVKQKDKTYKLSTSGWKEGVYIVRAKVSDKVITGKLVVKK